MRTRAVPSVLWREGMFLSTQHFQAFAREVQARAASGEAIGSPCGWGLLHLELDDARLGQDVLEVRALDALFPDGTLARVPGNAEVDAAGFADSFKGAELAVWLGVAEAKENAPQIDDGHEGRVARFKLRSQATYDENLRDATQELDYRVLKLRLFFGDEPPPGFVCLPLARLVREGRPVAVSVLSRDYVPPLMVCGASNVLMRRLRELAELGRSRARDLAAKAPSIARLAEVERGIDFTSLLLLQTVNRAVALLEQLAGAPDLDPFAAYLQLAVCCGDLAMFGPSRWAPNLPAYEHARSDACFRAVLDELAQLLPVQPESRYDCVPLERDAEQDYFHKTAVPADWFERRAVLYLAVQLARPAEEVARVVPDGVKLMAPSEKQRVMDSVVPGIALTFERLPPLAFPKRDDLHYFRIDTEGESHRSWLAVEAERAALVLNPLDELSQARFELYVEKPRRHE